MTDNAVPLVTRKNCFRQKPRTGFPMDDLRDVLSGKQLEAIVEDSTSDRRLKERAAHRKSTVFRGLLEIHLTGVEGKGLETAEVRIDPPPADFMDQGVTK